MIIRVKGHLSQASHDKTDNPMPGLNYPVRYMRQIPLIGEEGQGRLARAEVCICGAGGLGSPAALYLAAAGVGTIHLVDGDKVEESNLNRQILHRTATIGLQKVFSARELILALNPGIQVRSSPDWIGEGNAAALIGQADIVIDALDNFEARYVLNREARRMAVPLVHGAVSGFAGQATTVLPSLRTLSPVYHSSPASRGGPSCAGCGGGGHRFDPGPRGDKIPYRAGGAPFREDAPLGRDAVRMRAAATGTRPAVQDLRRWAGIRLIRVID